MKPFLWLVGVVVMSCYMFPFVPVALPFANSKMILAVIGLVMLGINLVKNGRGQISRDFVNLTLCAFAVSIIAFFSMVFNHTPDNTFVTYFMSMWVWLGGAYAAVTLIRAIHGEVSVPLVVNYMLAVCVMQCILALVFDVSPDAASWHDRTFGGEAFMGNTEEDRLHGIGCSLDVAGFRFAAVIVMSALVMYYRYRHGKNRGMFLYILAILFIVVVGDMISRSTVIGLSLALVLLAYAVFFQRGNLSLVRIVAAIVAVVVVTCVYLYNTDVNFQNNLRFGFEGFFSLAETNEWKSNSNDILKSMIVWPDNLKTWIIGDGYINNPADSNMSTFDPYYVGPSFHGFYKGTDIGYLRYLFYFGIIGLGTFMLFFINVCKYCCRRFPMFKLLFIMILLVNFIQWFKVSTDLFVIFAPFLCISREENDAYLDRHFDADLPAARA